MDPENLNCFGSPRCWVLCLGQPIEQLYLSTCRPVDLLNTSRHFEFETGISEQGISGLLPLARTANCRATAGCATSRCLFLLVLPYVYVNVSTLVASQKGAPARLSPVYIGRVPQLSEPVHSFSPQFVHSPLAALNHKLLSVADVSVLGTYRRFCS